MLIYGFRCICSLHSLFASKLVSPHTYYSRLQESIQPWGKWITFMVIVMLLYSPSLIWNWTNDGLQVRNLPFSWWIHMKNIRRVYQLYAGNTLQLDLGEWDFCCPQKSVVSPLKKKTHTALETKKCRYRRCHHFLGWGRMDDCRCFTEVTAFVLLRQCGYTAQSWGPNAPWMNEQLAGPNNLSNWHHFCRYHLIPRKEQTNAGIPVILSFWLPSNEQMSEVAANNCRWNESISSFFYDRWDGPAMPDGNRLLGRAMWQCMSYCCISYGVKRMYKTRHP